MTNKNAKTIIIVGPFPPPMTGMAKATAFYSAFLIYSFLVVNLRTNPILPAKSRGSLYYNAAKLTLAASNLFRLLLCRAEGRCVVYIAIDSGPGRYISALFLTLSRLLGHSVFAHHHSFSYIDRTSRTISLLVRILCPNAKHIFLDETMGRQFDHAYGVTTRKLCLSNAASVFATVPDVLSQGYADLGGEGVTIGFLSNLTREKGIEVVERIFYLLHGSSSKYRFRVAGPRVDHVARDAVTRMEDTLGSFFEYKGALYGNEKWSFLRSCDFLVFPTQYKLEAQPYVIFEAMAAGVIVLATDRGAIAGMLDGTPGGIVPKGANVAEAMAEKIETLTAARNWREKRKESRDCFFGRQRKAIEDLAGFLRELESHERP